MANKYERRRRALKEPPIRRENPFASPRSSSAVGSEAQTQVSEAGGHRAARGVVIAICCLLVLSTVAVFVQSVKHGFVNCDDDEYVYQNLDIQHGLTPPAAWWAITQAHSANWHPLTWMSHMLDWQSFGVWDAARGRYVDSWPGGHHAVNVLLHALNAVLLFLILQAMTGTTWPAALVAALFAIHPLRAESVAWVTERKDMLSGLFFLLTLSAYRAYSVQPFSWWRYGLVVAAFALGLTAKSMLVTLPFVLLLLDFWPLGRIAPLTAGRAAGGFSTWLPPRVILEKIPLLGLSAASSAMTIWAQTLVAAFKPLALQYRLGNAAVSYAAYIGQMFYPVGMVVQYVHPGPTLRLEATLLPLAVLGSITLAVVWLGWRRRYLAVGWLWYLGMLVPVIGLVQVGAQARADRYTYLTQIGLYIMIAWGLRDLARARRGLAVWYAMAAAPVLAALAAVCWLQTSYWRDSLTLWEHSVACQPENDFAENEYGQALAAVGRTDEAMECYRKACELNGLYITPRINYAAGLWKGNKAAEALQVCDDALQVEPNNAQARAMKAVALYSLNWPDESISEFRSALQLNPENVDAHANLARVLLHAKKDLDGAREQFQAALRLRPDDPVLQDELADVLWREGRFQEAIQERKAQIALQPQNTTLSVKVVRDLINDPRSQGRFGAEALEIARRLCETTRYEDILALDALAAAYAETGDFDQAEATIRKALETPQGRTPNNAAELNKRLALYHAHQKQALPPPLQ